MIRGNLIERYKNCLKEYFSYELKRLKLYLTNGGKSATLFHRTRKGWTAMNKQTINMNNEFAFTYYYFTNKRG